MRHTLGKIIYRQLLQRCVHLKLIHQGATPQSCLAAPEGPVPRLWKATLAAAYRRAFIEESLLEGTWNCSIGEGLPVRIHKQSSASLLASGFMETRMKEPAVFLSARRPSAGKGLPMTADDWGLLEDLTTALCREGGWLINRAVTDDAKTARGLPLNSPHSLLLGSSIRGRET
ncbi:unnamed protein product [Vitrella brassicaformis CCMP3155]|uniref:Uncharacterized protein n=1 Tax=Vitrella brassicaformis (strain CCMP3155) TaxID=1169540 RepID=A0A0G4EIV7_VITBC|nr:unnamed protein product [Vitrella brassicaformis CCMP3155]|eukprot:CEL96630.1 unnamed protein product [Vitrella brassicaformis CCMP3155]